MNWPWFEALSNGPRTSPGIRAVGLVLAIRAKRNELKCWPSIRSICKDASVGKTTACDAIRQIEKAGLLTVERRRGRANIYHLTVPASGTPTVPETGTVDPDPNRSSEWNSEGPSVPESGTPPFQRANPERELNENPSLVQEDDVSEVPY